MLSYIVKMVISSRYRIDMRLGYAFLLYVWALACYPEVHGAPHPETVTMARCYANCFTLNSGNNSLGDTCQTTACQECLIPCKGPFAATEQECQQRCNNSTSCTASCRFVIQVKNFNGDGSTPSKPGIPAVNETGFSSISLQWSPVTNASGTPVYLIGMKLSGDQTRSLPFYYKEVFVAPRATLTFLHLCRFIRSAPLRSTYSGISYTFLLAALTENSSISYGRETPSISLPKPDPVTNVTLGSVVYDGSNSGDKVKITISWTPSERQKQLVTKFAVSWGGKCDDALPRSLETKGSQSSLSMHIYHKLMACNHTVQVYAIINCSVSEPATLTYEYPGCDNVTNYPKDDCYEFDPPKAPIEERSVTNVAVGEMIVDDDYTFSVNLTWDPPVYPYKTVSFYLVFLGKASSGSPWRTLFAMRPSVAHQFFEKLLPGKTYETRIKPFYKDYKPQTDTTYFNFTTPAVAPDEVRVRNLKSGDFLPSPQAGRFTLNISWLEPSFNYSKLSSYKFSYKVGDNRRSVIYTNGSHFEISGIFHGEPVKYQVTPKYEHDWINGSVAKDEDKAPVPRDDNVKVRNLHKSDFVRDAENYTFSFNILWTEPAFNYTLSTYALEYHLSGYSDKTNVKMIVNETRATVSGVQPKESVSFQVIPRFANQYISGLESSAVATAPEPNITLLIIQDLRYEKLTISTPQAFSYNISWKKPLFGNSPVTSYTVLTRRKGNPERAKELTFTKKNKSFVAQDLIPGDLLDVEVTPVFAASVVKGRTSSVTIETPGPSNKDNKVRNLIVGEFVEDEENNSYSVNFTWEPPSFQHSTVNYYNLFYEFSGYIQDHLPCLHSAGERIGCSKTGVKTTTLQISGIFPREGVSLEVTPVYKNTYLTAKMARKTETAPEPREKLVTVVGLQHGTLVPSYNETYSTSVTWQKPPFQHSDVKHYKYRTYVVSDSVAQKIRRQAESTDKELIALGTNVTVDGINPDDDLAFEVTPVFVESVVSGRGATITLSRKITKVRETAAGTLSPAEIGGLVVGLLLSVLIVTAFMFWCYKERQKQMKAKGLVYGKNALMIDHWEVDGNLVNLEEELGEGAFGKVYKGFLRELPQPSRKLSLMPPIQSTRKTTIRTPEGFIVAVKMLHDMADSEQRREFLEEIQLMKAVGSHKNIVNMIGCCTVEEPMFLLVEYIPYGDLLHYLRKRRGKVKEYLGDESRGPYRSTYCETYVIDGQQGGVAVQKTRNDRIYANTPVAPKGNDGSIQLLSFNNCKLTEDIGTDNNGVIKDEADREEEEEQEDGEEEDENEETLTPGDLMAFAWQISQGMEYLTRKGFVHRDLAARNILVGDHKIAKVADFGLTRHVYEEKVYHAKRNRKLPLKWMSIEAIFDQTFTAQSDVWAFGVVLWELVTLGGTPYPTINNRELLRLLKGGYRMEKPDICNDDIYDMMINCWKEIADERPTFTQLKDRLEEMMQKDNPYLDFSVLDESREYYNVPSFNSLQDESTDDDVFENDGEALIRDSDDAMNVEERKLSEDANGNKQTVNSESIKYLEKEENMETVDLGIDAFSNSVYREQEIHALKNVKINIDELEMNLFRPRNRGLVL